jgi:hypothetical protein
MTPGLPLKLAAAVMEVGNSPLLDPGIKRRCMLMVKNPVFLVEVVPPFRLLARWFGLFGAER